MNDREPRQINDPQPGFWLIRCCGRCPETIARIWFEQTTVDPVSGEPMDRSPHLSAQIGLERVDWREVWHRRGRPISEKEFFFQFQLLRWLTDNRPSDPRANYRQPVNIAAVPIPRWASE